MCRHHGGFPLRVMPRWITGPEQSSLQEISGRALDGRANRPFLGGIGIMARHAIGKIDGSPPSRISGARETLRWLGILCAGSRQEKKKETIKPSPAHAAIQIPIGLGDAFCYRCQPKREVFFLGKALPVWSAKFSFGAKGGNRTPTGVTPQDPESCASTRFRHFRT